VGSRCANDLDQQKIALADAAYQSLNADHLSVYNDAIESIARRMDGARPDELRSQLDSVEVKLDQQKITLPLARYHVAPRSRMPDTTPVRSKPAATASLRMQALISTARRASSWCAADTASAKIPKLNAK
jgi:hypothetical protein